MHFVREKRDKPPAGAFNTSRSSPATVIAKLLSKEDVLTTGPTGAPHLAKNDPTRYLRRTRTVENKHEDEGGVNWKSLPAAIGNQGVGFAARGHAVVKAKTAWACFFDP
jgi:hypothetical protein